MARDTGRPLRVLAWVPYPLETAPGQRYRIEQWAPYLRGAWASRSPSSRSRRPASAGAALPARPLGGQSGGDAAGLARRFAQALAGGRLRCRVPPPRGGLLGPAWSERLLRARQPALVYDFDDAIYLPYVSPTNRYLSYLKFPWKTRDPLPAGGRGRGRATTTSPPTRVATMTACSSCLRRSPCASTSRGRARARPAAGHRLDGQPQLGPVPPSCARALQELRRRRPFRLLVVGVEHFEIPGVEVECRPWWAAIEVRDLWDLDVGIMPLPDEPWARGKCGMKAIQYMGVGFPPWSAPWGRTGEIVEPGANGLLAGSEDEWVEALDHLLSDDDLRARLGREARRTVEERFSAEAQAPRVAEVIRGLVSWQV